MRPHQVECGSAVVGDHDVGGSADLERLPRPACAWPGEAFVEPLVVGIGHAGGVEDRQPAVADLGCQRDILRPLGAEKDRNVGPQRVGDRLQRLAQTGGSLPGERQRVVRSVADHRRLPGQHLPHDADVLPCACQRLGELLAVPALDDLRAGHAQIRGCGGRRTGGRESARPSRTRSASGPTVAPPRCPAASVASTRPTRPAACRHRSPRPRR